MATIHKHTRLRSNPEDYKANKEGCYMLEVYLAGKRTYHASGTIVTRTSEDKLSTPKTLSSNHYFLMSAEN